MLPAPPCLGARVRQYRGASGEDFPAQPVRLTRARRGGDESPIRTGTRAASRLALRSPRWLGTARPTIRTTAIATAVIDMVTASFIGLRAGMRSGITPSCAIRCARPARSYLRRSRARAPSPIRWCGVLPSAIPSVATRQPVWAGPRCRNRGRYRGRRAKGISGFTQYKGRSRQI